MYMRSSTINFSYSLSTAPKMFDLAAAERTNISDTLHTSQKKDVIQARLNFAGLLDALAV